MLINSHKLTTTVPLHLFLCVLVKKHWKKPPLPTLGYVQIALVLCQIYEILHFQAMSTAKKQRQKETQATDWWLKYKTTFPGFSGELSLFKLAWMASSCVVWQNTSLSQFLSPRLAWQNADLGVAMPSYTSNEPDANTPQDKNFWGITCRSRVGESPGLEKCF